MSVPAQPVMFLPDLAVYLGLKEAIIFQTIHHRTLRKAVTHDGKKWMKASKEELIKLFPYLEYRTITRVLQGLEKRGLIEIGPPKSGLYRIDHKKFAEFAASLP